MRRKITNLTEKVTTARQQGRSVVLALTGLIEIGHHYIAKEVIENGKRTIVIREVT